MAKRYFLSPMERVEQVDTDPVTGETETTVSYVPAVIRRIHQQFPGVAITTNAVVGTRNGDVLTPPFALVRIEASDFGALLNAADVDALPDFSLAGKLNAMQNQTRTRMLNRLAARGLDVASIGQSDGYEDVIERIGQFVNPGFGKHLTTFFS